MERIKTFIKTSLLGGLAVILPVTITILIFKWIFNFVIQIIQPLTQLVASNFQEFAAEAIVLGIILSSCFLVGAIVKTKLGQFFRRHFENVLSKFIPGYGMIKSTVAQIFDRKKYPFSSVALIQAFENETLMTGFVIEKHPDDIYTVFVPCGPNPTTGYIFHLQQQYVHPVTVPVENALRSIISCGVGSKPLLDAFHQISEGKQA
ncbi:MAG: DUF502 domain-containing protein [Deltaproteobacteria bacterium]|nr:DUF502 domain-containing protein [Deltaproteobacteria bacterium]